MQTYYMHGLLPSTKPIATQACKDCTIGLDNSGPNIIFISPLSATSKDPEPNVIIPKTENYN